VIAVSTCATRSFSGCARRATCGNDRCVDAAGLR
jgi:hypothetical protein